MKSVWIVSPHYEGPSVIVFSSKRAATNFIRKMKRQRKREIAEYATELDPNVYLYAMEFDIEDASDRP